MIRGVATQVAGLIRTGSSYSIQAVVRLIGRAPGADTVRELLSAGVRIPDIMTALVKQARRFPPAFDAAIASGRGVPTRVQKEIVRAVADNWPRILEQLRDSRESSAICVRMAAGRKPTAAEMKVLKRQLADIARGIPTLAIFMMPFGIFVLAVLIKGLKVNLLPSAFQGEAPPREEESRK